MSPRDPVEVEELVTQVAWVRNLALAIARDTNGAPNPHAFQSKHATRHSHTADDLAQDAWVAALRRHPDASEPLSAWFARVLRNLVRFKARSDAHRVERERRAAKPERDDSPELAPELAMERFEMQEELLRAVRELDEPYRTTVILRWFESLEPSEIARRSNVPVRTVHTRITRALRMLRERLDRRSHGDRSAWMSAWIPLLSKPAGTWPWIVAMDVKLKIAIAGVAVVGALTALFYTLPAHESALSSSANSKASHGTELETPAVASSADASRASVGGRGSITDENATGAAQSGLTDIAGIVIDVGGTPVGGLDVEFRAGGGSSTNAHAPSDAVGSFVLHVKEGDGTIAPVSKSWTAVLQPKVTRQRARSRYVLVVAPCIALEGTVIDAQRDPIAGVEVRCAPPSIRERIALVLDESAWSEWKATSDDHGHFRLPEVPVIQGAKLETTAAGYTPDLRELPQTSRFDLEIVLKWPPNVASHLRGRVVDAHGKGIEGAQVALGRRAAQTDAAGRFDLDLDRALNDPVIATSAGIVQPKPEPESRILRALKQGLMPLELECATPTARDPGAWPDPLVLVLDRETLRMSGRVIDARGAPMAGVQVKLLDSTPFAQIDYRMLGHTNHPQNARLEALLGGHTLWLWTTSGVDGRFELLGLLPKKYRLRAFDPRTMSVTISDAYLAGTSDVELVIGGVPRYPRIAGRVVDRAERPVEGARVRPNLPYVSERSEETSGLLGDGVATDGDGRFEIRDLSSDVDLLEVYPPGATNGTFVFIPNGQDIEALVVRVPSYCHIQIDLTGSSIQADSFFAKDEKGRMLSMELRHAEESVGGESDFPLVDGRSEALSVSDDARTLMLYAKGKMVAEIPLHLVPDQLNIIRP
jgi:RNA polymerase sigma-70 factor (ECF subfamily)